MNGPAYGPPRWALWDFEAERWDVIPAENAPGEWFGGHEYGLTPLNVEWLREAMRYRRVEHGGGDYTGVPPTPEEVADEYERLSIEARS